MNLPNCFFTSYRLQENTHCICWDRFLQFVKCMPLAALALVASVLCSSASQAQGVMQGEVDYPYLGIKFTIPQGWKGQEDGDFVVLGSDTEPGLMGLTTNAAENVDELKKVADAGWLDEGIQMRRSGDFERIGAEGMGAEFSGLFQGAEAKAFIAGIINPFGKGVTIIALTSKEAYSPRQAELVRSIASSLKMALPKEAEHNASWRDSLPGRVLTAIDSSYSSGTPYYDAEGQSYGSYSSYSSRTTIHLCSNGEFHSNSSSSASFDAVGGFGTVHSGGDNQGKWQLATSAIGESVLQLRYANGTVSERVLAYKDGKTYLDGGRYYKTVSDACS